MSALDEFRMMAHMLADAREIIGFGNIFFFEGRAPFFTVKILCNWYFVPS